MERISMALGVDGETPAVTVEAGLRSKLPGATIAFARGGEIRRTIPSRFDDFLPAERKHLRKPPRKSPKRLNGCRAREEVRSFGASARETAKHERRVMPRARRLNFPAASKNCWKRSSQWANQLRW